VTADLAVDLIAHRFGADHHLASLFRVSAAIDACRGRGERHGSVGSEYAGSTRPYRLSPRSCVFSDVHDCGRLLERIRALPEQAPPLTPDEAGDTTSYLVVVADDEATHYRIEPGVGEILRLFADACSLRDAASMLQTLTRTPVSEEIFTELVDIGALIPSPAEHRVARPS